MQKSVSLQIKNLGTENSQDIIYVNEHTCKYDKVTVGMLYNILFSLKFPLMLKAKRFSNFNKIRLGSLELICNEIVSSYESSHRVIFYKRSDNIAYNPFGWDVEKEYFLSGAFQRYFKIPEEERTKINQARKKIIGVYIDPGVEAQEHRKYLEAVQDCIDQEDIDEIYLYDLNQLVKKELLEIRKIEIVDLSQEEKEDCIVKFCSCSYFVGTVSPFSYIVSLLKDDIGKFIKIKRIEHERLRNASLYKLEESYKENIRNNQYEKFCTLRVKNRNACFSEYMRRLADRFIGDTTIVEYLSAEGINSIGIYGWGTVGKMLYSFLKVSSDIRIEYIADKNVTDQEKVILPVQIRNQKAVDALIISPIFYYDEIFHELREVGVVVPIIPLEYFLYK